VAELLIVLAIIVVIIAYRAMNKQQAIRSAKRAAELSVVRNAVEEDVVAFGEDLSRLGNELPSGRLDEGGRADYRRALDAYEAAKAATDALRDAEETRHVTTIIDDGRYAIACVRARVEGTALPQRRPACFFDPRHGQSVTDVAWAPSGGITRDVPACALDAERVRVGAEPDTRQVLVGSQRVPYWQAGPAFAPMALGYFGTFGLAQTLFLGTAMGTMMGGGFDGLDAGVDDGGGSDSGGSDGGGFDGGGFDGGGFDF
jgi:uncharacterized membrane protein YgcG